MVDMDIKYLFAIITVISVTIIQLMAFALGIDGQVFAATLSVISALIGYILGIKIESNKATEIIDLITSNIKTNLEEIRKKLL